MPRRWSATQSRTRDVGEGIYVGSAESDWCDLTGCEPDRSDDNVVEGNVVRTMSAEAVDVKEGARVDASPATGSRARSAPRSTPPST